MNLDILISDGESILRDEAKSLDQDRIKNRGKIWTNNCKLYLNDTYPTSIITKDFRNMSESKIDDISDLVSILKGLRDVEDDLGKLH